MFTRHRILAVDDNPDTLELISLTLSEWYDVLVLTNPLDTYDLIELFEPDLLILDIMMPKITGFQLIELLRKSPHTREIPIVILSAKDNTREIKYGYKLGASLYLTKPFEPERLIKNIETQFRIHPPPPRPKTLTLNQVQIQVELKYGFQSGQMALSSHLLTPENIKRSGPQPAAEKKTIVEKSPEPPPPVKKTKAGDSDDFLDWKH